MDIIEKTRLELEKLKEPAYQKFASALIPNCTNLIGVRLPTLKKMAKKIAKNEELLQTYLAFSPKYMEETLLQAFVIGFVAKNEKHLSLIQTFLPKITNWSICDSFAASLKFTKTNQEAVLKFITPLLHSAKEFEVRFGWVMLLNYFVEKKYLPLIFEQADTFSHTEYYAQMSVAWCLSTCCIKFEKETILYLKKSKLDDFTFNKSLQKICESKKTNALLKNTIKKLKKV